MAYMATYMATYIERSYGICPLLMSIVIDNVVNTQLISSGLNRFGFVFIERQFFCVLKT